MDKMVYPAHSTAPPPNPDMPEEVKALYQEAANVHSVSPRAAGALLRVALEVLAEAYGAEGRDLYAKIEDLWGRQKDLPRGLFRAAEILRVVGNEQAHPGTINLNENQSTSASLFGFLNLLVEHLITTPSLIEQVVGGLPKTARRKVREANSGT